MSYVEKKQNWKICLATYSLNMVCQIKVLSKFSDTKVALLFFSTVPTVGIN